MSRLILPDQHRRIAPAPSAPPQVNIKLGRNGNFVVVVMEVVGMGEVTGALSPAAWRDFAAAGDRIADAIEPVDVEHPVPAETAIEELS